VQFLSTHLLTIATLLPSYRRLGLVGQPSQFNPKQQRFNVWINLQTSFNPGNSLYDRVIWCFKERMSAVELRVSCSRGDQSVDITFPPGVWNQKELLTMTSTKLVDVCLPRVAETLKTIETGTVAQDSKDVTPLAVPNGSHSSLVDSHDLVAASELLDWFGFVCCRLHGPLRDPSASLNPFVNSFAINCVKDSNRGTVFSMKSHGLFTSGQIVRALTAIR